jgi:hypothetical protein
MCLAKSRVFLLQRLDILQRGFPLTFQFASHQPVLRFNRLVPPLGAVGLEASAFQTLSPIVI